jgi:sugar/nucleoside kinase (ribokinase family)
MAPDFDVIVYGTVCLDWIWRAARLAAPGDYEPILEERRMIGGEAANTAIALSRWGVRVALAGTAMGDDRDGLELRAMFARDAPDVDIEHVRTIPGVQTAFCVCIATPDGHRTMYGRGFTDMQCPSLNAALLRRARLFTMDPNAYAAGARACIAAAEAGLQVVAMDYTQSADINRISTIAVTSHAQIGGGEDAPVPAAYAAAIRDRDGCTTIVTCGDNGCFVADRVGRGAAARHIPAYHVDPVVDSTGAGDIFRAGLIYGLLQEWDIDTTARFASAAAALNCTQMGGWGGVGTLEEVRAFQRSAAATP